MELLPDQPTSSPSTFPPRPPRDGIPTLVPAQIVRCACEVCGTHTNAVKAFRVAGSCPNCGSFRLTQVEGAEPLDPAA